jgi:hypothetical protein
MGRNLKKDGQYWTEREDKNMVILFTGNTNTKQWLHAYYDVLPRLKHMSKQILRKFFFVPEHKVDDVVTDAISHVLLKGNFDGSRNTKMYSYVGTMIKHYFYDKFITPTTFKIRVNALNMVDDNYDISEDEWLIDSQAVDAEDEFDTNERQEKLDAVLSQFNTWISKVEAQQAKVRKNPTVLLKQAEILEREMLWLITAKEFFNKYFLTTSVNLLEFYDYIRNNTNIPYNIQINISRKYLNAGGDIHKYEKRETYIETKVREEYGLSYLMDDYPINEIERKKSHRAKNIKNRDYGYF